MGDFIKAVTFDDIPQVIEVKKPPIKMKKKLWWGKEAYRKFATVEVDRRKSLGNMRMGGLGSKDSLQEMVEAGLEARSQTKLKVS